MRRTITHFHALLFTALLGVSKLLAAQDHAHQPFAITISSPQRTVKAGEDVGIHATLTNTSSGDIWIGSMFTLECDYSIQVWSKDGLATNDTGCGGSSVIRVLKPGEHLDQDTILTKIIKYDRQGDDLVNISKAFGFTSPGEYEIQLSRGIPDSPGNQVVTSNKITITVMPAEAGVSTVRAHPFSIAITTPRKIIKANDEVRVHLVLTNVSDQVIAVPTQSSTTEAEKHFSFAVIGPKSRLFSGGNSKYGGESTKYLKPGEQVEEDGVLNGLGIDFDTPGTYEIQFFRGDGSDFSNWSVKSNKIAVTVTE